MLKYGLVMPNMKNNKRILKLLDKFILMQMTTLNKEMI